MAEQNLKLPDLDKTPSETTKTGTSTEPTAANVGSPIGTKEMVIAFGGVLIAAIIFFILKNYVSKMLVASYKKSPRSADMAGWGLFCFLTISAVFAALVILDSVKYLTLPYLITFGLAMLLSLIMFIVALLSKR